MQLLTAFMLGFLGSFHCIGMCGPIVMALPYSNDNSNYKAFQSISYNVGRVITYSIFGFLLGFLGRGLFLGGIQQIASIITGMAIFIFVLFPVLLPKKLKSASLFQFKWFRETFGKLMQSKNRAAYFFLGMLNGFLPCGFVYIGLSASVFTEDPINAAAFMMMFGIGTIPAMFALSMFGNWFSINFRNKIKKVIPVFSIIIALILILRGMNLGIPYISPQITKMPTGTSLDCCAKPIKPN